MNPEALDTAMSEARRFLKRAEVLKKIHAATVDREKAWAKEYGRPYRPSHSISGCPETAAVKRASMDLSRALSQVRS